MAESSECPKDCKYWENYDKHEMKWLVDKLEKEELPDPVGAEGEAGNAWLQTLYREYCGRLTALDTIIWRITAFLLPLALAPYAVLASLDVVRWWRVGLLALASIGISGFWFIVTKKHFRVQKNWLHRLMALEQRIGIYGFSRTRACEAMGCTRRKDGEMRVRPWYEAEGIIRAVWIWVFVLNLVVWTILCIITCRAALGTG